MRFVVAIVCAGLFIGCQSPKGSRDDTVRIASSLERRITDEEARHILLDDIDRAMQTVQADSASHGESRANLEILARHRQRCSSQLESFLSRSRKGDELWTYFTATRPCREIGFALIRDGRVVEHTAVLTGYVGR